MKRVPSGELSQIQRATAAQSVNRKRRECPSRRFFVFPSVLCGLRHSTPCGQWLCFATVPLGVRKGLPGFAPSEPDLGQNSLTLSLDGVAELTHESLSGYWFWGVKWMGELTLDGKCKARNRLLRGVSSKYPTRNLDALFISSVQRFVTVTWRKSGKYRKLFRGLH
jgi:hypothetical protein